MGTPIQNLVYSETEFELVFQSLKGRRNLYSSVGEVWPSGKTVCDKVFYDFDTPNKVDGELQHPEFDEDMTEVDKFKIMREDTEVAEHVLGSVLNDAQELVSESERQGIPTVSVFTGCGIHVHQLYQPEEDPERKMESTGWFFTEQLELATADTVIFGDTKRLTRIPNSQRMDKEDSGKPIGLHLRPYTAEEILEKSVDDLLHESTEPRTEFVLGDVQRPTMPLCDGYPTEKVQTHSEVTETAEETIPVDVDHEAKDWLEYAVKLPCLVTHATRNNPDHPIRWSLVAYLFNIGLKPEEVLSIIRKLGWKNFDPETTKYQINNIWSDGQRSEHGCSWMMEHGKCVYPENPEDCPAHDWGGTEAYFEWPR